jgi:hypothetical protein
MYAFVYMYSLVLTSRNLQPSSSKMPTRTSIFVGKHPKILLKPPSKLKRVEKEGREGGRKSHPKKSIWMRKKWRR